MKKVFRVMDLSRLTIPSGEYSGYGSQDFIGFAEIIDKTFNTKIEAEDYIQNEYKGSLDLTIVEVWQKYTP